MNDVGESRYRRPGALRGNMKAISRPEMDGIEITVIRKIRGRKTKILKAICRPQFAMPNTEFRFYTLRADDWHEWDTIETWDNEGATWIRGRYEDDAPEVLALKAAFAL